MIDEKKIPKVALQFGDGPNDMRGRGEDKGYFDNGIWENVLGVPFTPNHGPRNPKGFRTAPEFGAWLIERGVDVLIWTLWLNAVAPSEVKRFGPPGLKIVGLTDHPLNVDVLLSDPAGQRASTVRYVQSLRALDAIMVLTPREMGFYGGIHPNVSLVGLPFPHAAYERLRVPPKTPLHLDGKPSRAVRVGLGVGGPGWAWWDRNYLTTAFAYRALQQVLAAEGVEAEGVWLSVGYDDNSPAMPLLKGVGGTTIQRRTDMETYLATLQSCDLVVSNIVRDTPGRLVGECAFFGVPCVGSNSLALQGELFPSLSHDPFDIKSTVETCLELVRRPVQPSVLENALEGLRQYGYGPMRERFLDVLESLGHPRSYRPARD